MRNDLVQKSAGDVKVKKQKLFVGGLEFDPEVAAQIREEAGLTQGRLVEELGFGKNSYVLLNNYEGGIHSPSRQSRCKFSEAYLNWLSENGYNPYGL